MAKPLTINGLLVEMPMCRTVDNNVFPIRQKMAAVGFGVMGLVGGCVFPEAPKTAPSTPAIAVVPVAKPTALTADAEAALQAAEQSVIEARIKRTLWTAAVERLKSARAAAQVFDSAATLEHAKEVVALCMLSIKQTALPPVTW